MSRTVDVKNLPSHRGQKWRKVDSSSRAKAPIIELNPSPVENLAVVLPFEVPSSKDPSCPNLELSTVPPMSAFYTFLRSKTLAWNKFKTVVNEDDVMACYDISIKEFECFTIHDLFKLFFLVYNGL